MGRAPVDPWPHTLSCHWPPPSLPLLECDSIHRRGTQRECSTHKGPLLPTQTLTRPTPVMSRQKLSNSHRKRVQEGSRVGEKVHRELLQHWLMKAPTRECVRRLPRLALTAAACPAACGGRARAWSRSALPAHGRGQPGRERPPFLGGASGRLAPHAHAYWRPSDGGPRGVPEEAEGRECGRRAWVSAGTGAGARAHGL